MKTELQRLEKQLARVLEGEAWHGPAVLEVLDGVSAHQAAAHPIAGPLNLELGGRRRQPGRCP